MSIKTFAVDDGYAYTKVAWMNEDRRIETMVIPSVAAIGLHLTGFDGGGSGGYTTDDLNFTVSQSVSKPQSTEFEDYPFSPMNRVIVHHALLETGKVRPGDTLEIALSVPMSVFYSQSNEEREQLRERRAKSFAHTVFPVGVDDPEPKSLGFSAVSVYPEAASAFIDYLFGDDGETVNDNHGPVAIVDVGGHTTDVAVMLEGFQIDQRQSGTDEIGVLNLIRGIEDGVRSKYKFQPFAGLAERALREPGNRVRIQGKIIDLSEIVTRAKHAVAEDIYQSVQRRIGGAHGLDAVVFVGGGATVMSDVLKSYPHVQVPPEPHFANARGMLKYMNYLR